MGRKIFPYTRMRGDQARPHQGRQLLLLPRQGHQLCLLPHRDRQLRLLPQRGCQLHLLPRRGHQLIHFSLLSPAYCLQLTMPKMQSSGMGWSCRLYNKVVSHEQS